MATEERLLLEPELRRVVDLLSWTDMSLSQIAEQMGCSQNSIYMVNRDFGVRKNPEGPSALKEPPPSPVEQPGLGF